MIPTGQAQRDKVVAYIERQVGDEVLAMDAVDVLPRPGQSIMLGSPRPDWFRVYDVKPVHDTVFDALVYVDRQK